MAAYEGLSDQLAAGGAAAALAALKTQLEESGKKEADARVVALGELAGACALGAKVEPLLVPFAPLVLKCLADKAKPVQEAAKAAIEALTPILSPGSLRMIKDPLLGLITPDEKFQTIVGALSLLQHYCKTAPKHVGAIMTDIVPPISAIMSDAKKEVRKASDDTMKAACATIQNKDLDPLIPIIINSIKDVNRVPECVHELAAVVFVQNVTSAALGLVVPLLLRGLNVNKTATKRQCAVITSNMSKLVEDPSEAAPFLPKLVPALAKASEEVSDPEARGVCGKAHLQLQRIQAHYEKNPLKKAEDAAVAAVVKGAVGKVDDAVLAYVANVACALCDVKEFGQEAWTEALTPYLPAASAAKGVAAAKELADREYTPQEEPEEEEDAEELCNCKFTLAYGTKILLHNTEMRLMRGYRYGLLGPNDCGKTTLMRAIANGQVENFPDPTVVKTVFVEADIQGEQSHLSCIDYIFFDPRIEKAGLSREEVAQTMESVGFTEKMRGDGVSTLSGGWRMKLALARAMLQKADILLLDEPTNHLDVMNVQWVMNYLNSLATVTSIIVSHDSKLLDEVCTHILQIEDLKLSIHKGNLSEFVKKVPEAKSYFELKSSKLKFTFPQPGFIEGVKSKGKPLIKMDNCQFTYPGNTTPTIINITVRVSLASRVACVGPNGAGKSTMIKLLTGETVPDANKGEVWKHPGCRLGYIAQHAFHHIENHLNKTPNEYIRWRYQGGDDKEALQKDSMALTPEEEQACLKPINAPIPQDDGTVSMQKRVVLKLTGSRREVKKEFEYEVQWKGLTADSNTMVPSDILAKGGFSKHMKVIDERIAMRAGMYQRPLTQANVEKHLEDVGLDREFGTHHRIKALSGGQKVKVVLASSMWNQPHILILDEPTNYLDRESLGALAGAIIEYEGGVVFITHNHQFANICPETWVLEKGPDGIARMDCKGDPEWMENVMKQKVSEGPKIEEVTDALGNTVKVKEPKKKLSNKEQKKAAKLKAARLKRGETVSDDDEDWPVEA